MCATPDVRGCHLALKELAARRRLITRAPPAPASSCLPMIPRLPDPRPHGRFQANKRQDGVRSARSKDPRALLSTTLALPPSTSGLQSSAPSHTAGTCIHIDTAFSYEVFVLRITDELLFNTVDRPRASRTTPSPLCLSSRLRSLLCVPIAPDPDLRDDYRERCELAGHSALVWRARDRGGGFQTYGNPRH